MSMNIAHVSDVLNQLSSNTVEMTESVSIDLQSKEKSNDFKENSTDNSEEGDVLYNEGDVLYNEENSIYSLHLKEFSPLEHLFASIPLKAQRSFESFDVNFTTVDASPDFVAVGTNIGTVYLYDRRDGSLERLRYENYIGKITAICSIQLEDHYALAFGFDNGCIIAIQIVTEEVPLKISKRIQCPPNEMYHKNSITSLAWHTNGVELFSGDTTGIIYRSIFNFEKLTVCCEGVFKEPQEVIQLNYQHGMIVVSTALRALVAHLIEEDLVRRFQIGKKARNIAGPFGIIFESNPEDIDMPYIYTSRPGMRLWRTDPSGVVSETMLLKGSLEKLPYETIQMLKENLSAGPITVSPRPKAQLGKLKLFQNMFILSWNSTSIYIIDPVLRIIVASCESLIDVIDIAVCQDEIFILQGKRNLRRLSSVPEDALFPDRIIPKPVIVKEKSSFSMLNHFFSNPHQDIGGNSSKTNSPLNDNNNTSGGANQNDKIDQTDSGIPLFNWLKEKLVKNEQESIGDQSPKFGLVTELPPIYSINLNIPVEIGIEINENPLIIEDNRVRASSMDANPLVYQVKKKKKIKKRVKIGSIDAQSLNISFESLQSEESNFEKSASSSNLFNQATFEASNVVLSSESLNVKSEADTAIVSNSLSVSPGETEDERLAKILNLYSMTPNDTDMSDSLRTNDLLSSCQNRLDSLDKTDSKRDSAQNDSFEISQKFSESSTEFELKNSNPDAYRLVWQISALEPQTPDVDIYSQVDKVEQTLITNEILKNDAVFSDLSSSLNSDDSPREKDGKDFVEAFAKINVASSHVLEEWIQYSAPGSVVCLALTEHTIYSVNTNNQVHYANLKESILNWKPINQSSQQISVSSSGTILWNLFKGVVSAVSLKSDGSPKSRFKEVASNVISIAVDNDRAWFVSNDGKIFYQQGLESAVPFTKSRPMQFSFDSKQIAARLGVVWVLTNSGRLFCRSGLSSVNPNGLDWLEIPFDCCENSIILMAIGGIQTGWIVDSKGLLWVKTGVRPTCPMGNSNWFQVELQLYSLEKPDTSKPEKFKKLLTPDKLMNALLGNFKASFASNEKGNRYSDGQGSNLLASRGDVIAHSWNHVNENSSSSNTFKWALISANGMTTPGEPLWAVYSTGELFCLKDAQSQPIFVPPPESKGDQIICLAPTFGLLWVITESGAAYIRSSIASNIPQGLCWKKLDDFQLDGVNLVHLSCAENVIWACDSIGNVLARVGPIQPTSRINSAWIVIDENRSSINITKVWVAQNLTAVWGLDASGCVYVRERVSIEMPIGKNWVLVPGITSTMLALSCNSVWALTVDGEIYKRCGIDSENCTGDYWVRIPGNFQFLTCSPDNILWALDKDGRLYSHSINMIKYDSADSVHAKKKTMELSSEFEEEEGDWEVV